VPAAKIKAQHLSPVGDSSDSARPTEAADAIGASTAAVGIAAAVKPGVKAQFCREGGANGGDGFWRAHRLFEIIPGDRG
jgi:hypothetical protein